MKTYLALSVLWIVVSVLGYSWVRYDITATHRTYEHYLTASGFQLIEPPPTTRYSSIKELVDDVTTVASDARSLPEDEFRMQIDSHFGSAVIAQQRRSLVLRLSIVWVLLTLIPIIGGGIMLLIHRKRPNHRPQLTGDAQDG